MNATNILTAHPLDILFEGRNKDYGAYQLRKTYGQRITLAITAMIAVCVAFLISSFVVNSSKKKIGPQVFVDEIKLSKFDEQEKVDEIKPPPPKPIEKPQIKTVGFTTFRMVKEVDVPPPTQDDLLSQAKIDTKTQDGKIDETVAPPVVDGKSSISTPLIKENDDDKKIFEVVQIQAKFPGGFQAWSKYLERNLNRELPIENGAPVGKYTVIVVFVVDKEGNISDVQAENDPGYGTKDEAIRIIKKSPAWEAAIQNGKHVICRHRQSITFVVDDNS